MESILQGSPVNQKVAVFNVYLTNFFISYGSILFFPPLRWQDIKSRLRQGFYKTKTY